MWRDRRRGPKMGLETEEKSAKETEKELPAQQGEKR